jgi:hypothetical protein
MGIEVVPTLIRLSAVVNPGAVNPRKIPSPMARKIHRVR